MIPAENANTLSQWFYTNAPAAWISALVAVLTCVILLLSRKKPQRLVIQENRNVSLIRTWPSLREKMKITFNDSLIEALSFINIEVFNKGSEVITNATFNIIFPEGCKVLETSVVADELNVQHALENNKVTITLPYINPVREHQHRVRLLILTDGTTDPIKVTGSGSGWSLLHQPLPTNKSLKLRLKITMAIVSLFLPLSYYYLKFIEKNYGISETEISIRALLASLPILLILIVFGLWLSKYFNRQMRGRSLTGQLRNQ